MLYVGSLRNNRMVKVLDMEFVLKHIMKIFSKGLQHKTDHILLGDNRCATNLTLINLTRYALLSYMINSHVTAELTTKHKYQKDDFSFLSIIDCLSRR